MGQVSNWIKLGGRGFLRSSAVYRCLVRYGASESWAVERLKSVMSEPEAIALVQSWRGVKKGGR